MLKIVKTSIVATALPLCLLATKASAGIEDDLQNICNIVVADDKNELRKKMRKVQSDYRLRLQDYYSGITCGGQSLIRTAMLNNAVEAGTLLVKKMPKEELISPEQDGKTIATWASEAGLQTSPLMDVLQERI